MKVVFEKGPNGEEVISGKSMPRGPLMWPREMEVNQVRVTTLDEAAEAWIDQTERVFNNTGHWIDGFISGWVGEGAKEYKNDNRSLNLFSLAIKKNERGRYDSTKALASLFEMFSYYVQSYDKHSLDTYTRAESLYEVSRLMGWDCVPFESPVEVKTDVEMVREKIAEIKANSDISLEEALALAIFARNVYAVGDMYSENKQRPFKICYYGVRGKRAVEHFDEEGYLHQLDIPNNLSPIGIVNAIDEVLKPKEDRQEKKPVGLNKVRGFFTRKTGKN